MDRFIRSNLEEYLSGQMGGPAREEFRERLRQRPRDRKEIEEIQAISGLFQAFQGSPTERVGPSPGFYARVLARIETQRKPGLWETLFEPVVFRRVALASCAWLLTLLGAGVYDLSAEPYPQHMARAILSQPPESEDYCNIRMGWDIDMNRSSMLAAVMISGSSLP